MKLKEALQRASRLVSADKTQQVLRHILLVPATADARAMVIAGDGQVWTHLTLDEDVEVVDAAVAAEQIRPLLTEVKEIERIDWGQGGGAVKLTVRGKTGAGGSAEFRSLPSSQYPRPKLPSALDFVPEEAAHELAAVVHAVGGADPVERHLGYVHASPDGLAASDGYRIALLQYAASWRGLLSPRLFTGWKKREAVSLCIDVRRVYVRLGDDEVRQAAYAQGPYPDPWNRAQALTPHTGPRLVVETAGLATAVKQAFGVGAQHAVALKLRSNHLYIESVTQDESQAYRSELSGAGGEKEVDLLVNGKMLYESLKAIATPKVLLGYRRPFDPLRLESGRFIECIWPMEG